MDPSNEQVYFQMVYSFSNLFHFNNKSFLQTNKALVIQSDRFRQCVPRSCCVDIKHLVSILYFDLKDCGKNYAEVIDSDT